MEAEYITRSEYTEYKTRIDVEQKRQNEALNELEERVDQIAQLNSNIERLAVSMESMQKEQTKQGERLEKLESKDGEMWQTVVKYALSALVGGLIAFLLAQIGVS